MKTIIHISFLVIAYFCTIPAQGQTFCTSSDGDFETDGNWVGGTAPTIPITTGVHVIIKHDMTSTVELTIEDEGTMTIQTGSYSADEKLIVKGEGVLYNYGVITLDDKDFEVGEPDDNEFLAYVYNYGTINAKKLKVGAKDETPAEWAFFYNYNIINLTDELRVDGYLTNAQTGIMNIEKAHVDGEVCNAGTIQLEPGEEYKNHGGLLHCCGNLYADVLELGEGNDGGGAGGANLPSRTSCQNICDVDGVTEPDDITIEDGDDNPYTGDEAILNPHPDQSLLSADSTKFCELIILPVNLVHFGAKLRSNNDVLIQWTVSSETDNDYFSIERSSNGIDFHSIGQVNGQGNSQSKTNYEWLDKEPHYGISYYRLKQMDFDRTASYSKIVSINYKPSTIGLVISPNPSQNGRLEIRINDINERVYVIRYYNIQGQLVLSHQVPRQTTLHFEIQPRTTLAAGWYIVEVQTGTMLYRKRFLVER